MRVRVRIPEPHVSVQDPHTDHSAHPTVVVANVVVAIVVAGAVVINTVVVGAIVVSAVVVIDAPVVVS